MDPDSLELAGEQELQQGLETEEMVKPRAQSWAADREGVFSGLSSGLCGLETLGWDIMFAWPQIGLTLQCQLENITPAGKAPGDALAELLGSAGFWWFWAVHAQVCCLLWDEGCMARRRGLDISSPRTKPSRSAALTAGDGAQPHSASSILQRCQDTLGCPVGSELSALG